MIQGMLLLIFVVYIVVELMLFGIFGRLLGGFGLFIEVIGSALLGLRAFGAISRDSLLNLQTELFNNSNPSRVAFIAIRPWLAGLLLIAPGLATDCIGLLLWLNSARPNTSKSEPWEQQADEAATASEGEVFDEVWEGDDFERRKRQSKYKDVQQGRVIDINSSNTKDE